MQHLSCLVTNLTKGQHIELLKVGVTHGPCQRSLYDADSSACYLATVV